MFDKMIVTKNENENTYKIQIKGLVDKFDPKIRYNAIIPKATEPLFNIDQLQTTTQYTFSRETNMKIESQIRADGEGTLIQMKKLRKRKMTTK